ncbi:MAG: CBS domain-containing protein [Burkholderiales bacterium]
MGIQEVAKTNVVCVRPDTTVRAVSQLMREHHVGSVVVVEEPNGKRYPVGIVTDRDIVVAVTALDLDPKTITVGDLMAAELVCVQGDAGVSETVELMRLKGVRRVPVTSRDGALVGIVSADDMLFLLAEEISGLARMVAREQKHEAALRRTSA